MTEVIYFVLGVGLALIGVEVYLMVNMLRRLAQAEKDVKDLQNDIPHIYSIIDQNVSSTHSTIQYKTDQFNREVADIYRYIDSRVDKTEFKLTEMYKGGCEPVQKTK